MKYIKTKVIHRYDNIKIDDDMRAFEVSELSQIDFLGNNKDIKSYCKFNGILRIKEKGKMVQYEKLLNNVKKIENLEI